jgi:hypothetical protein
LSQSYANYVNDVTEDVKNCLESMQCLPILFVGSGISRRYFNAPNWEELLKEMADGCPLIDKEFAYYKQIAQRESNDNPLIQIGTMFGRLYHEWAWGEGKSEFPEVLFTDDNPDEIYIKYKIAEHLNLLLSKSFVSSADSSLQEEIRLLQKINPHALITTNYDLFLEDLFKGYTPIIGQQILKTDFTRYGEIFKIHGCVSDPQSLIVTKKDYDTYNQKKKYLSAKLLTYFVEHPLLFIGYSAEDPNIKSILSNVDEIISAQNELIPNIYILEWKQNIDENRYPLKEKIIHIGHQKSIVVKSITASSFKWVFEAFGSLVNLENVNPKLLRALVARTYKFVRTDIPNKSIELNYENIENAVNTENGFLTLLGITTIDNPSAYNAAYPYTITSLSNKIGYINKKGKGDWQKLYELFQRIKKEKGIDLQASDNLYHVYIKSGQSGGVRKYSDKAFSLLNKVKNNEEYALETD